MKKFIIKKLNLQLFAEGDPVVNTTASSGLTAEMKTFYSDYLIDEAGPNLIHNQFGQKQPIPKNGGKTIEFRKYAPLVKATTPLTEGKPPVGKSLSVSTVTASVGQYGDFVAITDMLDLTAIDNNLSQATKLLGQQAGQTLDTLTRDILVGGTNVSYCPKVSGSTVTEITSRAALDPTAKLTVDMVNRIAAKLKGANAPTIDGSYVAIIHPYVAYDLMSDPAWIDVHKYAKPDNIFEGEIGKIGKVRFVETTEAKVYNDNTCPTATAASGDDPAVYHSVFCTLFLGANSYGVTDVTGGGLEFIFKNKGTGGTADPLEQKSTTGWKATHTAEILINDYLVRCESCSPRFDATAAN